jgi:diphthine-ammonia ligase
MSKRFPAPGIPFFCSWSGGKDCCLALYRAVAHGGVPAALVSMLIEEGGRTRNHGLATAVVQAQAEALKIPLVTVPTSWPQYEERLVETVRQLASQGIQAGVFGDIDIPPHRQWEENVCAQAGLQAFLPLWQEPRHHLLEEFLDLGYEARIVAVKDPVLDPSFLGKSLDREVIAALTLAGVDACGEYGEYHTVVTKGPLFRHSLQLIPGEKVLRSGYWFQDFSLATKN